MFIDYIFCLENKPHFNVPHVAGNHLHRNQNPAQGSSSLPSSPLVQTFVSTWPGGCEQMQCCRRRRIREEREGGKRYSERARGLQHGPARPNTPPTRQTHQPPPTSPIPFFALGWQGAIYYCQQFQLWRASTQNYLLLHNYSINTSFCVSSLPSHLLFRSTSSLVPSVFLASSSSLYSPHRWIYDSPTCSEIQ